MKKAGKFILSSKFMTALYLCYETVLFIVYYSDNGFLISRQAGHYRALEYDENAFNTAYRYIFEPDCYYYMLDIRAVLEFALVSLLPLALYWIIRLIVEAKKEMSNQ